MAAALFAQQAGDDDEKNATGTTATGLEEPPTTPTTVPPPLATISCPLTGAQFETSVAVVRGTADLARVGPDRVLWLAAWSESPEGEPRGGFSGYPHSRIVDDEWAIQDVTIAEADEEEADVELRIYALTKEQSRRVEAEYADGADLVYVHEDELTPDPEARVVVRRNVTSPVAQPC